MRRAGRPAREATRDDGQAGMRDGRSPSRGGRSRSRRRRISLPNLIYLYRARQRTRHVLVADAFAIAGLAVGVALLFASQVASTSLTRSVQRLSGQLVGDAQFQLSARGPAGASERVLAQARSVRGVKIALPVLEQQVVVIGPRGQRSLDLIGTDPRFAHFGGPLLRRFSGALLAGQRVIGLPNPVARAIGAGAFQTLQIQTGARVASTLLGATLGSADIGSLVDSPVALAPVAYAQQVAGMEGRVSRIFIQTIPGQEQEARSGLRRVAENAHLNLDPADFDVRLFAVAASPQDQSETLFSGISAIVGFLLAINAMLLTAPRRRRMIAHVRRQGANRFMALQLLLFDALVLGAVACVAGLALGDLLSVVVFRSTPGYLSFAFPVGNGRIVTWQCVGEAVAAGMAAACAGVLLPLRDLYMPRRWHAAVGHRSWIVARAALAVGGLAVTTAILIGRPQNAQLGNLTLVVSLLCVLPFVFDGIVAVFARLQAVLNRPSPRVTLTHLRVPRTRVRSLAIIATAAVACFGVVSIEGAQRNLETGLAASARGIDGGAGIWVTARGEANAFATTPFEDRGTSAALSRLPGVRGVGEYRGSFLNWGDRRLWVLASPSSSAYMIPPSEIAPAVRGVAETKLRGGGWAVVSSALAAEHGLHVGDPFTLPSPQPSTFRVAALSTNLGWAPGTVILNSADYARAWASSEPSGYQIYTRRGAKAATVRREIQAALGPDSGFAVETATERERRHVALAQQGLMRLTQIRVLMLIAAMLAIAGALGSLIWQRRSYIAFVRALGFRKPVLQRWLLWEGAILLAVGCLAGTIFGVYGQLLVSHALASVTGFPIVFGVETLVALSTFAFVSAGAVAVVSVAGYLIVRVPPRAARPAG